jgi:Phasin protein
MESLMSETETNIAAWQKEVSQIESVATETMQSTSETMTRNAEKQREVLERAAEQFGDTSRGFVQHNAEKMHTLMAFGGMAQGGAQDLQSCLNGLVEGVIRTNLRLAQEIFLVESPRAFVELQQRFLRDYFDVFQQDAAALIRATEHASVPEMAQSR